MRNRLSAAPMSGLAGAGTVDVQLHQRENQLQATISDHGRGFDLSSVDQGRHGLSSIRERAEALGGRARIVSTPGMGATVFVSLPLRGLTEDGS